MTTIEVPDDLAREIDRLAGVEGRSDYATQVLWLAVRRNWRREALDFSSGSWKLADHPELADAGAASSEKVRSERDDRFEQVIDHSK